MAVSILRAAARRALPWKNGGGLTHEVAVEPPASDLANFDWRISLAHVTASGPFSSFPGIERHMAILEGRLALTLDGECRVLSGASEPISFDGELAAQAAPLDGPVSDLNVMVRRARGRGRLLPLRLAGELVIAAPEATTLVLLVCSAALVETGDEAAELAAFDAVRVPGGECCLLGAQRGERVLVYRAELSGA